MIRRSGSMHGCAVRQAPHELSLVVEQRRRALVDQRIVEARAGQAKKQAVEACFGASQGELGVCERLFMVAEALKEQNSPLAEAYLALARAEARHHGLFFRLARACFDDPMIDERAARLLDYEAELVRRLPHRAAVH